MYFILSLYFYFFNNTNNKINKNENDNKINKNDNKINNINESLYNYWIY